MTNQGTGRSRSRRSRGGSAGDGEPRSRRRPQGDKQRKRPDGKRREERPSGGGPGGTGGPRSGGRPGPRGGRRGKRGPKQGNGTSDGNMRNGNFGHAGSHSDSPRSSRVRTASFEELFADFGKGVKQIGLALRDLIMEVLPNSEERVHLAWKIALYNEPNEVCGIQPVSKHCNLYFSNGARMNDPEGLLEGSGKSIRHVKVRSTDDMPVEQLKSLIAEAKRVAG